MSNIRNAFKNGKAFIPFITCGYPDLEMTGKLIRKMADSGADLIVLGIPFSDPTVEGAVVQSASIRALKGGITTDKVFTFVQELRRDVNIPLVFMTYANVVFSYGIARFAEKCAEAGVDGILVSDVPFEEKEEFAPICRQNGVDWISMIAPASDERIAEIAKDAEGFLYVVSDPDKLGALTAKIRAYTDIPCVAGFDAFDPAQTAAMAKNADGVIAVSAVVEEIGKHENDAETAVGALVKTMKQAVLQE